MIIKVPVSKSLKVIRRKRLQGKIERAAKCKTCSDNQDGFCNRFKSFCSNVNDRCVD